MANLKNTKSAKLESTVADACVIEVDMIELHLGPDSDLPKRFGKRIKAMGGIYRACRGNQTTRFVHIPMTDEGLTLCDTLRDLFGSYDRNGQRQRGSVTVIFRGLRTHRLQAHQHVFTKGDSWVSLKLDLADMLRDWDRKVRATIADPEAHCHEHAINAQRDPKLVVEDDLDLTDPEAAPSHGCPAALDTLDTMTDQAIAAEGLPIGNLRQSASTDLTATVATVLASVRDALKGRAEAVRVGMEVDIDGDLRWFARARVPNPPNRRGTVHHSLANGDGGSVDEAVNALIEDVEAWVAMFKVDTKLKAARKAAR